ncbi:MAG: hypothetical protein KKE50_01580 [Nanoarchaeota archaeon]|nr:hypothetical protein [Nanoarchaeota archaeon]
MKKIFILAAILLLISPLVLAENDTTLADAKQTLTNIGDTGKNLAGNLPTEKINPIVEVISWVLLGTKLEFGLTFGLAIFFWIVLFLVINGVVSTLVRQKIFSITGSILITSIAMHSFSGGIESWIGSLTNTWLSAAGAIATGLVILVIMTIIKKVFLKRAQTSEKIEKVEKIGAVLKTSAEIEKKKLDSYKDINKP